MIKYLENEAEYESVIKEGKVLVDFFATWCGPCKMLGSVLVNLADEKPDLTIIKIDVDKFPRLAERYNVQSIPTLLLFDRGVQVNTQIGYLPLPHLRKFVG